MNFFDKVAAKRKENNTLLCAGFDPTVGKGGVTEDMVNCGRESPLLYLRWARPILKAVASTVCAIKPNLGYYTRYSWEYDLERLSELSREHGIPFILDAKWGDIGKTAEAYAETGFERYKADALTLNPLLGYDSVAPYLEYDGTGLFLLCHTSNEGSKDLQEKRMADGNLFYEEVAELAVRWNEKAGGNRIGLVLGATFPEEIAKIRSLIGPDMFMLIPGIGAQGGDIKTTVEAGGENILINSSSAITNAKLPDTPASVARATKEDINKFRNLNH